MMTKTLSIYATPSIEREGNGWHIRVLVRQEGERDELLDAGVWPLIEPAARILAEFLAEEKVRLWKQTMEKLISDRLNLSLG